MTPRLPYTQLWYARYYLTLTLAMVTLSHALLIIDCNVIYVNVSRRGVSWLRWAICSGVCGSQCRKVKQYDSQYDSAIIFIMIVLQWRCNSYRWELLSGYGQPRGFRNIFFGRLVGAEVLTFVLSRLYSLWRSEWAAKALRRCGFPWSVIHPSPFIGPVVVGAGRSPLAV